MGWLRFEVGGFLFGEVVFLLWEDGVSWASLPGETRDGYGFQSVSFYSSGSGLVSFSGNWDGWNLRSLEVPL